MTERRAPISPLAWLLLAASALTLASCVGGAVWLGWRIMQPPPLDTTVYDPTKPLHENPSTRLGNYNTDEPLEFRWRSADGSSVLHMRIPGEWIIDADGTRPGMRNLLQNLGPDDDDGVASVQIRIWLSEGPDGLVATPMKLMLARKAPGQAEITEPGMGSVLTLKPTHYRGGVRPWTTNNTIRQAIDFDLKQTDKGLRQLADKFGLERYRPQACGQFLPPDVDEYPLLAEEPAKDDGCRDLGNPPEWWVSPRDEPDGVAFDCYPGHGRYGRRPYCAAGLADYREWHLDYSIPMDHMHNWQDVREAMRKLLASWEVPQGNASGKPDSAGPYGPMDVATQPAIAQPLGPQ
jgi:hypothetical protein